MMVPLVTVAVLMVVMTTKHLVADFLLQSGAMARGKAAPTGWLGPLTAHAGIHAGLTLVVVLAVAPRLWWLAPLEFLVHAVIDRGKVWVGRLAVLDPSKDGFWWLLGLDQYLHALTNIALVLALVAWSRP